jgi:hypothetical protein
MAKALDARSVLDEMGEYIKPLLMQAIKENWTAEQLQAHPRMQLLLTAKALSIATTEIDSAKAMNAIKDIKDRTFGKAKERVESTHKLEKLPDEQLDSLLRSKLGEDSDEDPAAH